MGHSKLLDHSLPTNESVDEVVKNDIVRYKRKGYGLVVAIFIVITYLTVVPEIIKSIYPRLLEGWDPRWFVIISASSLHFCWNTTLYLTYYVIYKTKLPFFERYRILHKPWPWEGEKETWKKLFPKSIGLFFLNNLVIAPGMMIVDTFMMSVHQRISAESMPTAKEIISQIFFCMLIEDFCFYWGHRFLHHRWVYPHIHKVHHTFTHTVSIANEYTHPVEFLISNILPSVAGPKLLGKQMHLITFWLWVFARVGESVDGHGGYEFSWSPYRILPLSGSANYHDFHHSANVGNYCSLFTFWDTVFKTNSDYWIWLSKHEKKEDLAKEKGTEKAKNEGQETSALKKKRE